MTPDQLLDAIGQVEDSRLDAISTKPARFRPSKVITIAACACLLLLAVYLPTAVSGFRTAKSSNADMAERSAATSESSGIMYESAATADEATETADETVSTVTESAEAEASSTTQQAVPVLIQNNVSFSLITTDQIAAWDLPTDTLHTLAVPANTEPLVDVTDEAGVLPANCRIYTYDIADSHNHYLLLEAEDGSLFLYGSEN